MALRRVSKRCHIVTASICLAILASQVSVADYHAERVWDVAINSEAMWIQYVDSTLLVVGTELGILGVHPSDGSVLWKNDSLNNTPADCFALLWQAPYSTVTLTRLKSKKPTRTFYITLYVCDCRSGEILWSVGYPDTDTYLGSFRLPNRNALLVCMRDSTGKERMSAVEIGSGNILWENKTFFDECKPHLYRFDGDHQSIIGNQLPVADSDTTMITFLNKKTMRKWNVKTGELIWTAPLDVRKAPAPKDGFPQMFLGPGLRVIYVAAKKTVYAVDVHDGSVLWSTEINCKEQLHQMVLLPEGLLVRGGQNDRSQSGHQHLFLLNNETGDLIWGQRKMKLDSEWTTNFLVEEGEAVVYSKKKIYAVSLQDGSFHEVATGLKLRGKEEPSSLSLRDGKYQLISPQNVMLVDDDGKKVYHSYYKGVGDGLLGAIGSFARNWVLSGGLAGMLIDEVTYGRQRLEAEKYGMTTNRKDYLYIFGNLSKKGLDDQLSSKSKKTRKKPHAFCEPGIVKINKTTGDPGAYIILDHSEPVYAVDNAETRLFHKRKGGRLRCVRF